MMQNRDNPQSGFTLVEAMVGIFIMTIALAMMLNAFSFSTDAYTTARERHQMNEVFDNYVEANLAGFSNQNISCTNLNGEPVTPSMTCITQYLQRQRGRALFSKDIELDSSGQTARQTFDFTVRYFGSNGRTTVLTRRIVR